MWIRLQLIGGKNKKEKIRYIQRVIELTSRVSSSDVTKHLQDLEHSYPSKSQKPVDICLATNMISVGLDISRLGLMSVIGQPKTTSEYIQATSRVGRSSDKPGLVFTIYNTSKPRDRSFYENFISYHSKIYSHVEPTSVTPYSSPVRERALHALLVGLLRYLGDEQLAHKPYPYPKQELIEYCKNIILQRVDHVDESELDDTERMLNYYIQDWDSFQPLNYGNASGLNQEIPLIYPYGVAIDEDWKDRSWPTPTSMRSVDVTCEAFITSEYPNGNIGEEN
nr:helicase-related protein [Shimazuella soli]